MITCLEIIDTAIKIGLGALITGIATFLVTKQKYHNELQKEFIAKKQALLHDCIFRLDNSTSLQNNALSSIFHKKKKNISPIDITDEKKELMESFNLAKEARTFAYLTSQKGIVTSIDKYLDYLDATMNHIENKGLKLDINYLNDQTTAAEKLKRQIYEQIGKSYNSASIKDGN
jgi:hypothetical protein